MLFEHEYIVCQNKEQGIIQFSQMKEDMYSPLSVLNSMYNTGNFIQEINTVNKNLHCCPDCTIVTGTNLYVNCNAQLQSVCNLIRDDINVSNKIKPEITAACSAVRLDMMAKHSNEINNNREFISCCAGVNKSSRYVQKVNWN